MESDFVWSFTDLDISISHPSIGQVQANGAGIGTLTKTMATTRTTHDISSDGVTMISKIPGDNGTLAMTVQQTSGLNQWLTKWLNYIKDPNTPPAEFALATVEIRNRALGQRISATGVSFEKEADLPNQAQAQQRTWTLMAASIQTM